MTAYTDRLSRAQSVVFVSTRGVTVTEIESMRDLLFQHGLQLQVAKNSLLSIALADAHVTVPLEMLDEPVALVYSYDDAIAGPKHVAALQKDIEKLAIFGGIAEHTFITPAQVEAYAKLPSREQLLGQLVGTLNAPISGLVNVFAGNLRSLVTVLSAVRDSRTA